MTSQSEVSWDLSPSSDEGLNNITARGSGGRRICRTICFIGAGYVGGPTAAVIALHNPDMRVVVVDKDATRIAKWKSRHLPVHEPGLYTIVRRVRDGVTSTAVVSTEDPDSLTELFTRAPNLFFSTDMEENIAQADVIFLSVNTNTKTSGAGAGQATDLAALESATQTVAKSAKQGAIVVEKSTVPCRTAQVVQDILKAYRPEVVFDILSNPEFSSQGTAVKDLMRPDRILIGSLATPTGLAAADMLASIYSTWVDPSKIIKMDLWSSELAKLVANAMLAQRISSINSISAVCERVGASVDQVAYAVGLDSRVGSQFLKAGIGFGGSCFKKDISSLIYLANSLGLPEVGDYWMQVLNINEYQRVRFVNRIVHELKDSLKENKIAILGYTFKKGTNDTRGALAVEVIQQLLGESTHEIAIFDPQCEPGTIHVEVEHLLGGDALKSAGGSVIAYPNVYSALKGATAAIILTDWDQFRYPSLVTPSLSVNDARPKTSFQDRNSKRSETEFLVNGQRQQGVEFVTTHTVNNSDIVNADTSEPPCPVDCYECERQRSDQFIDRECIDWVRAASIMEQPKWIFDGRGVVDVPGIKKLGFRVESIGRGG